MSRATEQLVEFFSKKYPDHYLEVTGHNGMQTLHVKGAGVLEVLRTLKTDPRYAFNFLSDVTAIDHLLKGGHTRYSVVYHLLNQHDAKRIVLHAWVDEEEPELPSAYALWRTCDWQEREVFDLFGIKFTDHPDLRRILNPDNFDGHPLRKDYPLEGRGERADFRRVSRTIGSKWETEKHFE